MRLSGLRAVVVLISDRDIIDIVYNDMRFLHEESCGKCRPAAKAPSHAEILGRWLKGDARQGT
jgi:NADH:ubiquinone oxidoreductase subunit F (NADH-binding)